VIVAGYVVVRVAASAWTDGVVPIVVSCIAAGGTVLTAWVGVIATQTKRRVNGQVTELQRRVQLLELVLSASAMADETHERPTPPVT
jgi:hypothetical protein